MGDYFRKLRRKVGNEAILVPEASAIVLNDRDEILLTLRADTGRWALPGGVVDLGETVTDALRRRVFEAAGVEVTEPKLIAVYSGPEFETTRANGERTASVTLLFLVDRFDRDTRGHGESREMRFHRVDKLPDPIDEPSRRFIDDWLAVRAGLAVAPIVL